MRRITTATAVLATLTMVALSTESADAYYGQSSFGLHIGGRNASLSIGTVGAPAYTRSNQVAYRRPYSNPAWYGYESRSRVSPYRYEASRRHYSPDRYTQRRDRCDYRPGGYVWQPYPYVDHRHYGHPGHRH